MNPIIQTNNDKYLQYTIYHSLQQKQKIINEKNYKRNLCAIAAENRSKDFKQGGNKIKKSSIIKKI